MLLQMRLNHMDFILITKIYKNIKLNICLSRYAANPEWQ